MKYPIQFYVKSLHLKMLDRSHFESFPSNMLSTLAEAQILIYDIFLYQEQIIIQSSIYKI
jgi:hypothetical protein